MPEEVPERRHEWQIDGPQSFQFLVKYQSHFFQLGIREPTHGIHDIMIGRRGEYRFWQNSEPCLDKVADGVDIIDIRNGVFA